MSKSLATRNKEIRQEAVREQLATYGLVTQVLNTARELDAAVGENTLSSTEVAAKKASADLRMKLVDKYLPNLQAIEQQTTLTDERPEISDKPVDKERFDAEYSVGTPEGTTKSIN